MRLDVGASLGQETAASSPILGPLLPFSFSQGVAHPCSFFFLWLYWVIVAPCGLSLVAMCGLLIAVASLVAEHRL